MNEALEQIRCAQVNLENLGKLVPGLSAHPYFQILKSQLDAAENALVVAD